MTNQDYCKTDGLWDVNKLVAANAELISALKLIRDSSTGHPAVVLQAVARKALIDTQA